MNTPNPMKMTVTVGIKTHEKLQDRMSDLWVAMMEQFKKEPDVCTDGGNDKHFFSFTFLGVKMFAAENEVGGLTIMLPEEY